MSSSLAGRSAAATLAFACIGCGTALAGPTLELAQVPGPGITIAVRLREISSTPVAGWQAFVEFDPSRLAFVSGSYVTTRFGLPVIAPITAQGNQIDMAAGINPFLGQSPTGEDQDIAFLTFTPTVGGCLPQVRIRTNNPPTRLTDALGISILPLAIINPWTTCLADINRSGTLDVQDIFDFLSYWFANDCRADFNGAGGTTVQDIFDFLSAWFAGCP